jgi:hypothetical protein
MIKSVIERGIEDGFGLHVSINAPEFFQRKDFIEYVENNTVFTWHESGTEPGEWSDVAIMVEPILSGEGDSSDMPEDIWDTIMEALKQKFGVNGSKVPPFARQRHIIVRISNLEI